MFHLIIVFPLRCSQRCLRSLQNMFNTLILFDYLHAIISLTFAMFQITVGWFICFFDFFFLSIINKNKYNIYQTTVFLIPPSPPQTSNSFGETAGTGIFIVISLYHQFLNNFFGEYIIQKVNARNPSLPNTFSTFYSSF